MKLSKVCLGNNIFVKKDFVVDGELIEKGKHKIIDYTASESSSVEVKGREYHGNLILIRLKRSSWWIPYDSEFMSYEEEPQLELEFC